MNLQKIIERVENQVDEGSMWFDYENIAVLLSEIKRLNKKLKKACIGHHCDYGCEGRRGNGNDKLV